jgi:hypothetical protein
MRSKLDIEIAPGTPADIDGLERSLRLEMENKMVFENRFVVTRERYMDWVKQPIKGSSRGILKIAWTVLFILMLGLVVPAAVYSEILYAYIALIFALVSGYRAFLRTRYMANKQFKQTVYMQGAEQWERVTTFAEDITVADGCSVVHFDYDKATELVDMKDYLALGIGPGRNKSYLRLAKEGFGQNTYKEFTEYVRREHPHIPVRFS